MLTRGTAFHALRRTNIARISVSRRSYANVGKSSVRLRVFSCIIPSSLFVLIFLCALYVLLLTSFIFISFGSTREAETGDQVRLLSPTAQSLFEWVSSYLITLEQFFFASGLLFLVPYHFSSQSQAIESSLSI